MIPEKDIVVGACFTDGATDKIRQIEYIVDGNIGYKLHNRLSNGAYEKTSCGESFHLFHVMYAIKPVHCFKNEKGELEML